MTYESVILEAGLCAVGFEIQPDFESVLLRGGSARVSALNFQRLKKDCSFQDFVLILKPCFSQRNIRCRCHPLQGRFPSTAFQISTKATVSSIELLNRSSELRVPKQRIRYTRGALLPLMPQIVFGLLTIVAMGQP